MRSLTGLLFLQILVSVAFGQGRTGKISGSVQDAGGKPMEAVSVSLLKNNDPATAKNNDPATVKKNDPAAVKVAVTDRSGRYAFNSGFLAASILSVTHVGYTHYSQPLEISPSKPSVSVNPISLRPSDGILGEVTVVGKKPLIENKIDKTVVNVDTLRLTRWRGLPVMGSVGEITGRHGRQ